MTSCCGRTSYGRAERQQKVMDQRADIRRKIAEFSQRLAKQFSTLTTDALHGISPEAFRQHIESRIGAIDVESEDYAGDELDVQRDLSVKFFWGHDHDFGEFRLSGRMEDRHVGLLAAFCALFSFTPESLAGKDVLDVGCWTGGTSLMLALLGCRILAVEEVKKYAEMARFLAKSFGLSNQIEVAAQSIYALNSEVYHNRFDVIYLPGVVYHLSDPVIALRILYNACKIGGTVLIETEGLDRDEPVCLFTGSRVHLSGSKENLDRGGWNWFVPSPSALARMLGEAGFEQIETTDFWASRFYACARKNRHIGICRAGLSVPTIA